MGQSIDPASEAICALMVSPSKKTHLRLHHSVPNRHPAVRGKHVFHPPSRFPAPPSLQAQFPTFCKWKGIDPFLLTS